MARKPETYWEKRNTEMMKRYEKNTEKTIDKLVEVYNHAQQNIEKEIQKIYKNYAKDGVLSKQALEELLNKRENDLYYKDLLDTIKQMPDSDIKKTLIAKYNGPAYSYRISRYESLKEKVDIELKKLASIEEKVTKSTYENIIKDSYTREIYEIQKGIGLGFSFADLDTKTINMMLAENWVASGNYSKRIWNNTEKLGDYLSTHVLADNLSGKSIQKMSRELSDAMNIGMYQATQLLRTEVNHFANEGEMLAYEECDIDKYQFIATLDNVTCDHCGRLDKQIFNVKDRKTGVNYPPIHPNDRCTTIAYFDDETMESMQRRARDPETGRTYVLDKNISYEEWKEQYCLQSDSHTMKVKKNINKIKEDAFKLLPQKFMKELDYVKIERHNETYSLYNTLTKKIFLAINADEYDLIHELAHAYEAKFDLYKNEKFVKILKNKFRKYKETDFKLVKHEGGNYYRLKDSKEFVSSYQTRIYKRFNSFKKGRVNVKHANEYFSEGLKYYYKSPDVLFQKDKDLYTFIRDLMWRYN